MLLTMKNLRISFVVDELLGASGTSCGLETGLEGLEAVL